MKKPRMPIDVYQGVKIYESHAFFECGTGGTKSQVLCDAKFQGTLLSGTLAEIREQLDGLMLHTANHRLPCAGTEGSSRPRGE